MVRAAPSAPFDGATVKARSATATRHEQAEIGLRETWAGWLNVAIEQLDPAGEFSRRAFHPDNGPVDSPARDDLAAGRPGVRTIGHGMIWYLEE
jgi:hypothetical protein